MHRALILAATSVLMFAGEARTQAPVTVEEAIKQQPDQLYFNGATESAPAVERSLPLVPQYRSFLPVSVDLSSHMPPVGDQGRSQSCAAWSTGYAARSYYTSAFEGRDIMSAANVPSPSYIFHLARTADWGCVEGTNIPRVVEVMRHGALSMANYPFNPACRAPAPPELVAKATDFRVQNFERVDVENIEDIKGQLSLKNPVIIRFNDSVAFQKHRGAATFHEPVIKPGTEVGWHSFTLVGYDERRQAVKLINSWGIEWGDHGYGWMSYDTLSARSTNAYVIEVVAKQRPVASSNRPLLTTAPPAAPAAAERGRSFAARGATAIPAATATSGLARLADLNDLPCSKLTAAREGDRARLTGFVASPQDRDEVKRAAADAGVAVGDIAVLAWPRCELMLTLATPLAAGDSLKIIASGAGHIEVRSPAQPRFLYVSVLTPEGSVQHLLQPGPGSSPVSADVPLALATPASGGTVVMLAAAEPLFDAPLPSPQTARQYLSALRRALLHKPSEDAPDRVALATIATATAWPGSR